MSDLMALIAAARSATQRTLQPVMCAKSSCPLMIMAPRDATKAQNNLSTRPFQNATVQMLPFIFVPPVSATTLVGNDKYNPPSEHQAYGCEDHDAHDTLLWVVV